jgi:SAM-dependent methyltransferase
MVVESSHWGNLNSDTVETALRFAQGDENPFARMLRRVSEYQPINSVADLGCGLGYWYTGAKEFGTEEYMGYDIPEVDVSERFMPAEKFTACDLSEAYWPKVKYDICCATEVAEHLPYDCAREFVRNTTRFSDVVLFSAAIPYQSGKGHVNENWVAFWNSMFKDEGFVCYDIFRFYFWNDPSIPVFYRQNLLVYVRRGSDSEEKFGGQGKTENPLSVVHPEMWIKGVNRGKDHRFNRMVEDVVQYYEVTLNGKVAGQTYFYGQEDYEKLRK